MTACFYSWSRIGGRSRRRRRNGLSVVAAMVCLLIVTSIVSSMLIGALRARRQLTLERDRRQAELLVEAGADRAVSLLAENPGFRGDKWELPTDAIVGRGKGQVVTEISRIPSNDEWQLNVVAEYPLGRDFPIRRSRTFSISVPTEQVQEKMQ